MSVKKEQSGRRSVSVEVEVPLEPEQVWDSIATGPGMLCWFMSIGLDIEPRKGGAMTMDMDGNKVPIATVDDWDPPHRLVGKGHSFGPEGPMVTHEWTVQARSGDASVVRVVTSLFAETDDWDGELESLESGWPRFFRVLFLYLTRFRGQPGAIASVMLPTSATVEAAWSTVSAARGLADAAPGDRWATPDSGAPRLAGVLDDPAHVGPQHVISILDEPRPAILFTGVAVMRGVPTAHLSVYHYGDDAAEVAPRQQPQWQTWLQDLLPAPG